MNSARSTFRQVTMQELANSLENQLKRPVTDAAGLPAKFNFVLTYATEAAKKKATQAIAIDHIEKTAAGNS